MSKARIVHITLAKCGSQWVRDVLCAPEIVHRTGMPDSGVTFVLGTMGKFEIPKGMFSGPIFGMNRVEWQGFKSPGDKALVVLRDPRDSLVSLLFSVLYSHGANSLVDYVRSQLLEMKGDSERITRMIGDVGYLTRFYLSWAIGYEDDAQVVRYEDLIQDQRSGFGKIIDWLGWQVPNEVMDCVVERLSFKARSGRNPGEADVSSHYRRGISGDWRNHFTREHGRLWEQLYPGFLASIGYEKNNGWWESLPEENDDFEPLLINPIEMLTKRNQEMENELFEKEREIRNLAQICNERLELINQQSFQLKALSN